MPLILGQNLSRYYGGHDVFTHVNFQLDLGHRVGLVGPNGGGKTTLMRLIMGADEPNGGRLELQGGLRLGYLAQTPAEPPHCTLWELLMTVFADLRRIEDELHVLSEKLADPAHPASIETRYSDLQHEFEMRGGYTYTNRLEAILSGLGFAKDQYHAPLTQLSGGWRTRANLARLLLEEPDVLLLDEPTNHLDLDSVQWLEGFLNSYKGGLLIVSHDRYFLDKVTTDTWEMAFGTLETYPGNYTTYVKLREARYRDRLKQYEAQQVYIRDTEEFIRRHIAGQRSQEAKGRRQRLARFMDTEAIARPPIANAARVRFVRNPARSGDFTWKAKGLVVGYDKANPLLEVKEWHVMRGERWCVLGPNGSGKTTLLRTLLGELPPLAGEMMQGANVQVAYFSQRHDHFDPNKTVLDTLHSAWQGSTEEQRRRLLGGLLFSGDEVFQPVHTLSGGQRGRLALAMLAVSGANLLILDEPSNHLDIPTQEMLEELLVSFAGTMLLVTHDRYLVRALATGIAALRDGKLQLVPGGWAEYERLSQPVMNAKPKASAAAKSGDDGGKGSKEGGGDYRAERKRQNELKRNQERYEQLEKMITELEDQQKMAAYSLNKASEQQNLEEINRLSRDYEMIGKKLEALLSQWQQLGETLGIG